jgi:glycosyltransferase involved in cell wall biosynthesis
MEEAYAAATLPGKRCGRVGAGAGRPAILRLVSKLSAVIIAQNEQAKIPSALESVAFCDEVLVVDSGSTDRTRELAEKAGARVILNAPWPGFVAQRNFAVDAARHDAILAIDADERVSPPLRTEIEALRQKGFAAAGYRIPRVAFYMGRWIRATDWYPDPQTRLFDRRRGRWQGALVHESVRVEGSLGRLRGEMIHYPYDDISAHLRKIDSYTSLWARQAHQAGRRTGFADMTVAPFWAFLRNYVARRGFVLGAAGLTISTLNAYYTFVKLAKLAELGEAAASPQ